MDANLFAVIRPYGGLHSAMMAIQSKENCRRYVPGSGSKSRGSRESTPGMPADDDDGSDGDEPNTDRLELYFDDDPPLKDPAEGWLFGYTTKVSDVAICVPGTIGVSRQHFALSITPDFRIHFHQKTIHTTRVFFHSKENKYKPHEILPKRGDQFIVSFAPWEDQYWSNITVVVSSKSQEVHLEIIFPNHTKNAHQAYYDNMTLWLQNRASWLPPLGQLGLDSMASTVAPSRQSNTPPVFSSLCYQRVVGSGAFGRVELLVDLTTGRTAARKRFFQPPSSAGREDPVVVWDRAMDKIWNEVCLMQQNPHKHIMRLLAFQDEPVPSILMPYYPLGNIESVSLQPSQYRSAFRQLLLVLDYLHGRNVAHRDLKPENILLASVSPLHIVVSDFGLSKEGVPGRPMTTFCGTRLYGAPDVFPSHRRRQSSQGYWVSVDIWSGGVIMLEWTYGRPDTAGMDRTHADTWIKFWSRAILNEVRKKDQEYPGDPVMDVLKHMLLLDPDARSSARDCLQLGCSNGLFKRTRGGDVIDVWDDDPDDAGARTPTQIDWQKPLDGEEGEDAQAPTTTVEDNPPVTNELWASAVEKQDPSHSGNGGSKNSIDAIDDSSQASSWQKFIDFSLIPSCPSDVQDGLSQDSDVFVSAAEEIKTKQSPPPTARPPPPPPPSGTKRLRHSESSSAASAHSSSRSAISSKDKAPPRKKRPVNVGYDSAVWSDVLGSQPRLGSPPSPPRLSGLPSSMSLISMPLSMAGAASPPKTITSSMSLLDGASNLSARMA